MAILPSAKRKVVPYSLNQITDILLPALKDACHQASPTHGTLSVELAVAFDRDVIQLIVTDYMGRKYHHPRFIERMEVENGTWFGVVEERFRSTIDGVPTNKPGIPIRLEPSFTLSELEEAERLVASLK